MSPRTIALIALIGLVGLSIIKGYLGIDDASTVLISTVSGAVVGFYFGRGNGSEKLPVPP